MDLIIKDEQEKNKNFKEVTHDESQELLLKDCFGTSMSAHLQTISRFFFGIVDQPQERDYRSVEQESKKSKLRLVFSQSNLLKEFQKVTRDKTQP